MSLTPQSSQYPASFGPPVLSRPPSSLPPPSIASSVLRAGSMLSRQTSTVPQQQVQQAPPQQQQQFPRKAYAQSPNIVIDDDDEEEETYNDNTNSKVAEVGKGFSTQTVLVDRLRRQFDRLDVDKSGFLDYNEMDGLLRAVYEPSEEEVEEFMTKFDNNGDGQISFAEFREAMQKLRPLGKRLGEKHLRHLFDFYDQDKNGSIDGEELRDLAREALEIDSATKLAVMNVIDTNKDRRISFEEFASKVKSIHLVSTKKGTKQQLRRVATLMSESRV